MVNLWLASYRSVQCVQSVLSVQSVQTWKLSFFLFILLAPPLTWQGGPAQLFTHKKIFHQQLPLETTTLSFSLMINWQPYTTKIHNPRVNFKSYSINYVTIGKLCSILLNLFMKYIYKVFFSNENFILQRHEQNTTSYLLF